MSYDTKDPTNRFRNDPYYLQLINVVGLQRSYTKRELRYIERVLADNTQPTTQRYLIASLSAATTNDGQVVH